MDPELGSPPNRSTEETYKKVATENGVPVDVEKLDGCILGWAGPRTARSIIMYIHGGGLVEPAYDAHIQLVLDGWKVTKTNDQDVSIAFLAYGLAPSTAYPEQHRQMIGATNHLLRTRFPESISFAGDSVGAMLTLSTLLHIHHPIPTAPAINLPTPNSRFNQAFLISPAAGHPTDTASMRAQTDIVSLDRVEEISRVIEESMHQVIDFPNPWFLNVSADESWWSDLPIGKITITTGEKELWRDDILTCGERIKKQHDREVVVFCGDGEFHDNPFFDLFMGVKEDKAGTKLFKQWFEDFRA